LEKNITQGVNLIANYQWRDLELGAGISHIRFFNPLSDEFSDIDVFTPTTELSGKLSYQLPYIDTRLNFFLRVNDRFVSYYPDAEDGETVAGQELQDGFTMVDMSFSKSFYNKRLNLTAGIRNLLNITQVNVVGGVPDPHNAGASGLPIGPGRSFFVRANLRLFDNRAAKFKNPPLEQQQKSAFKLYQNDAKVFASWIENRNDGDQVLQYAERKNKTWARPKTIGIGDQQWFVNDMETPQIVQFPQNSKLLLASWLENNNPRNVYDHHLVLSKSKNNGKQWSKGFKPYDSVVPAYYGLLKIAPSSDNEMLAVWMDGRDTKRKLKNSERYFPKLKGKLRLYSNVIDKKGKKGEEVFLTDDAKALCPYELQSNQKGTALLAYRNGAGNIALQKHQNNQWSAAQTIHEDQWNIKVTTEGPLLDIQEEKVAIAWYTELAGQPKLQVALSTNHGDDFIMLPSPELPQLIGQMDMVWLDEATMALAWLEKEGLKTVLKLGYLDLQGQLKHQEVLFNFPGEIGPNKPQLAVTKDEILIAWKPNFQTDLLLLTRAVPGK
ncbi:MAG: TonB-dependent receptor, partial [Bacteroidota bacterium]